jgi:hypothetical protein
MRHCGKIAKKCQMNPTELKGIRPCPFSFDLHARPLPLYRLFALQGVELLLHINRLNALQIGKPGEQIFVKKNRRLDQPVH